MSVGILGAGIIGLSSALALSEAGFSVTIVARYLPGDTPSLKWSSPWAGAGILPHPDAPGHELQIETFKYYWALAHRDPTSGVQVVDTVEYYDDRVDDSTIWYKTLVPLYKALPRENLIAVGATVGFRFQSMTVNPVFYLPWAKSVLESRGVTFLRAEVKSFTEARELTNSQAIVNATGLGARDLASDELVVPIRGQTVLLGSDFEGMMMFQGSNYTYTIPRMYSNRVVAGGVTQEGDSPDTKVDAKTRLDILNRVNRVNPAGVKFGPEHVLQDIVGFRPGRKGGYRLEREGYVIHAYGFSTLGYTYSYGVGLKVTEMVKAIVQHKL